MHANLIGGLALAVAALGMTGAAAQDSQNRVAAHSDWSVFEAKEPAQCWSVSSPKETVNTRDGRVVAARRGDILLFVSYIPDSGISGQVSFTGGYPFRDGSTVSVSVGESTFELFTEGEMAWSASDSDDKKIIDALKKGAEAKVVGMSSRGTRTEDVFSLFGFTAAVEEAEKRCSS